MSALFADLVATAAESPSAAGLRSAALTLHAMDRDDRAWMLGQLEPAQRAALDGLLAELRAMGLPADPQLVREALDGAQPPRPDTTETEQHRLIRGLSAAAVVDVAALLGCEPAPVVERLLRLHPWPWRPAVQLELGRVRSALRPDDGPPLSASAWNALDRQIVSELLRLLPEAAVVPPQAQAPRWWDAVVQRLGRRVASAGGRA